MNVNLMGALLILAACSSSDGEVVVGTTPGGTVIAYLPASLKVTAGAEGEVRRATVVTHNPASSQPSPDAQVGGRGEMEFACSRRAYRQLQSVSIRPDGSEVVAVPADPARPFAESRPGSLERKLADAVCGARS